MDENVLEKKISRRMFLKCAGTAGALAAGLPLTRAAAASEVLVGAVHPVTGPLAELGIACRRAAQLAVDDLNNAGGIKSLGGAKIKLLLGDSETKATVGRTEAERLPRPPKSLESPTRYTCRANLPSGIAS